MKIDTLLVSAALFTGTADCFAPSSSRLGTFDRQETYRNHEQGADSTTAAGRKRPRAHSTRMESITRGVAASGTLDGRHIPSVPPPPRPSAGLPPRLQAAVDMLGQDTDLKTKSKLLVELGDAFAGTEAAALPQPPPAGETDGDAVTATATSAVALADGWYARKVPGCVSEVRVAVRVDKRSPPLSPRAGAAAVDDALAAGGGGGIVSIRGTADARLSRGLLALLALGLQGQSPRTVLGLRGKELAATVGMRAGLTDSRINGLGNVLGVIQDLVRAHFRRTAAAAAAAAGMAGFAESLPSPRADLLGSPDQVLHAGKIGADVDKASLPGVAPGAAAQSRAAAASQPRQAEASTPAASAAPRGDAVAVPTNPLSEVGSVTATVAGLDPSRSWGDDASSWYPLPGAENEVAMLLSGGVDSSVAMRLLQDQGYKIRAFYLKIWLEDELAHLNECPWEEDLAYATAVCKQAGVPLEVVPLQKEYWDEVVSYTVREAREGRTPNPDVMCNSRVKFGMFYDHVGKHFRHVATGHYARLERHDDTNLAVDQNDSASAAPTSGTPLEAGGDGDGGGRGGRERVRLLLSPDAVKDQTYFLCALTQDQLRKALFPLGGYTKDRIRELAESFNLPTKNRKDSQGICFLGKLKFDEFLQHYLGTSPGTIVDQSGRPIGKHRGLWFHTIGQRKGVGPGLSPGVVNLGPWYVADKDMKNNVLVVTNDLEAIAGPRKVFRVEALQWISGQPPAELAREGSMRLQVKTRHGPQMRDCLLRLAPPSDLGEDDRAPIDARGGGGSGGGSPDSNTLALAAMTTQGYVKLDSKDSALAPGQFAAFYVGDECLGAGVMCGWSAAAAAAVDVEGGERGAHLGSGEGSKPAVRRPQPRAVLQEQNSAAV